MGIVAFLFSQQPISKNYVTLPNSKKIELKISNNIQNNLTSTYGYSLGLKNSFSKSKASEYVFFQVNKQNSLGQFAPDDLVVVNSPYALSSAKVSALIVNDLKKMIDAAALDGIDLKIVSGYRSYSDQQLVFNNYVNNELRADSSITRAQAEARANRYSAYPGQSEHQLGTTVDLLSSETNYTFNVYENMSYAKWIENNAAK